MHIAVRIGMESRAPSRRPCIFVLSERAIFRDCLVCVLQRQGFRGVVEADGIAGFWRRPGGRRDPDLVLLDLRLEKADPRTVLHRTRRRWPAATVVAIGSALELAAHAREAHGYLQLPDARARDIVAVAAAMERPHRGPIRFPLSPAVERERRRWDAMTARERNVLDLLVSGADNLKIAAMLGVSERAVKAHLTSLFEKFGVENRTELALLACHAGLHGPSSPLDAGVPFREVEELAAAG
jgi:two-component system, NarL family, nitrate/nitrite response regulator NarL